MLILKIAKKLTNRVISTLCFFLLCLFIFGVINRQNNFVMADGWVTEVPIPFIDDTGNQAGTTNDKEIKIAEYVNNLYKFIVRIVGILGAVMFMIGGFQYLMSAGNTAVAAEAKKTMFAALAGIVIVLTAYILLRLINKELVELEDPTAIIFW